jgi:nucleoside-diphosphate-sugar epimerase
MWFVQALAKKGHTIVVPLRKEKAAYEGVRKERVNLLANFSDIRFSTPFESVIHAEPFDLFCHHAADVTNYKSPTFDPIFALKNNANALPSLLEALRLKGCHKVLLTGSIFEQNEGAGSDGLRAVSPYGLSKGLTSEVFKYYCETHNMRLGKFVIPNPFGPYEEFRFTSFLVQNWFENKKVNVSQPAYVRDNIPVSLLAEAYQQFAQDLLETPGFQKINPSGYPESQGAFTERFASEMRKRLNLLCDFTLSKQTEFPEPKVRINTDLLNGINWDETAAWDTLAQYYEALFSPIRIR